MYRFLLLILCLLLFYKPGRGQTGTELLKVEGLVVSDTTGFIEGVKKAETLTDRYADSAEALLDRLEQKARLAGYTYGLGMVLAAKGLLYIRQGKYERADQVLRSSVAFLNSTDAGRKELPRVIAMQGNVYYWMGLFDKAQKAFYKGINIAGQVNVNPDFIYNRLAGVLIQMNRGRETVWPYLDLAEISAMRYNNYLVLCNVYINKAVVFSRERVWDSSLYYNNKALTLAREQGLMASQHLALTNLGSLHLEQKKPEKALLYLEEAMTLEQYADQNNRNYCMSTLGNAYIQLQQYQKAEAVLQRQYREAMAMKQGANIREAHYNLSLLYRSLSDYKKAYEHAWGYITLNDAIAGEEIINNVNQHEAAFQVMEKDKKIVEARLLVAQKEKALERKNRWITMIVAGTIISLLIAVFLAKSYRHKQRIIQHKLDDLEKQQKIDNLLATIEGEEKERTRIAGELHDGIGGLISAAKMNMGFLAESNYTPDQKDVYESTMDILKEAGAELRMTAHNMMPSVFLQYSVLEAISSFCKYIGKSRKIDIDVRGYGNFESLSEHFRISIYRVIQELVHNIAKHAQAEHALVQLIFEEPILSITVEDDGIGFDKEAQAAKGAGLSSVQARVESMGGSINLDTSVGNGTSVYIEIEVGG